MSRRLPMLLAASAASFALVVPVASARWYGSLMREAPNATYGCESAMVAGPLGGVGLQPTNQTTCTYRHGGYLFSNRPTFLVPRSGRIARVRVKGGDTPTKLRVTILTGSSRVDPFTGRDQPGTYTCCTARYIGKAFRVAPRKTTTKRVNVRVHDVRDKRLRYRIHSTDGVALSAAVGGTLPLYIGPNLGALETGAPLATSYFPRTEKGDPRVDGYSMAGIDLLFQWDFRRR